MKYALLFLAALPLLSGCIFGNKNSGESSNKEPQTGPGAMDGFVSMLDARGFTEKGVVFSNDVVAQFTRKASARKGLYSIVRGMEASTDREMKCVPSRETRETSEKSVEPVPLAAAALSAISIGRLRLELDEALLELPFDNKSGNYYYALQDAKVWKKGIYTVRGEGSSDALAFAASLSMPDVLEDAKINGALIYNGGVQVPAQAPIEVTWKPLSTTPENNYMFFQVTGEKGGGKFNLLCAVKEADQQGTWTIPARKLKDLTTDITKAKIHVYRGNLGRAEDQKIGRLDTEGMRLAVSTLQITN